MIEYKSPGAYLPKSVLGMGAYSVEGLILKWGLLIGMRFFNSIKINKTLLILQNIF